MKCVLCGAPTEGTISCPRCAKDPRVTQALLAEVTRRWSLVEGKLEQAETANTRANHTIALQEHELNTQRSKIHELEAQLRQTRADRDGWKLLAEERLARMKELAKIPIGD